MTDMREYGREFVSLVSSLSDATAFVDKVSQLLEGEESIKLMLWRKYRTPDEIDTAVTNALASNECRDEWEFLKWIMTHATDKRDEAAFNAFKLETEAIDHEETEAKEEKDPAIIGGGARQIVKKAADLIQSSLATGKKRCVIISGPSKSGKSLILHTLEYMASHYGRAMIVDYREASVTVPPTSHGVVMTLDDADVLMSPQDKAGLSSTVTGMRAGVLLVTCTDPSDILGRLRVGSYVHLEIPKYSLKDMARIVSREKYHIFSIDQRSALRVLTLLESVARGNTIATALNVVERLMFQKMTGSVSATSTGLSSYGATALGFREADLHQAIEFVTGIRITSPGTVEGSREIARTLRRRIKGQNHIIRSLVPHLIPVMAAMTDPLRPAGVFLFYGPTGSGKTEMARAIAKILYGGVFHKEDMNTYLEKHQSASLIGSPPGYVGYDKTPPLLTFIDANKRGVILFDEIEKAHDDIMTFIMELLETGIIKDAKGAEHDARGFLIVMTSNVTFSNGRITRSLGFGRDDQSAKEGDDFAPLRATGRFKPEFLGRLDYAGKFGKLDDRAIRAIARSMLTQMLKRLRPIGIVCANYGDVVESIVKSYNESDGARSMRRYVETSVKTDLLEQAMRPGNQRESQQ